jgi:cell division topological specificity factor
MSFLSFFLGEKKNTASVAKERLQIILAHERSGRNNPGQRNIDMPALRNELVTAISAVLSKHMAISTSDIQVSLESKDNLDVLEVKIELPEAGK